MRERARTMMAAFLDKPGHLYLEQVPVPECGEAEVLIRVHEVGICGSDLHYYKEGRVGDNVVRLPRTSWGTSARGSSCRASGVPGTWPPPGDRVTVEPGLPCLACPRCLEGRYNLCPQVRFLGAPPNPGAFRELLADDARFVYRLPDSVSFTAGALAEPLAVGYNAAQTAESRRADRVIVLGAGAIGLSCLEMARPPGLPPSWSASCRRASWPSPGARGVPQINPRPRRPGRQVRVATGGRLVDCAIEASGSPHRPTPSVPLRKGGRVALVGLGLAEVPHAEILKKEAVIAGVYRYANQYRPVIELLKPAACTWRSGPPTASRWRGWGRRWRRPATRRCPRSRS